MAATHFITALVFALVPGLAAAAVCGPAAEIRFVEGAPSDAFVIENTGQPGWEISGVEINLAPSAGRLVIDAAPGGEGTQVWRAVRSVPGEVALASPLDVKDGDEALSLAYASFPPGATHSIEIDLDDRVRGIAGTMVNGAEIAGAAVSARFTHAERGEMSLSAAFDAEARARLWEPCAS